MVQIKRCDFLLYVVYCSTGLIVYSASTTPFVAITLQWRHESPPSILCNVKVNNANRHQEDAKRFNQWHNEAFWGELGGSKTGQKMAWESYEGQLAFVFIIVRRWRWGENSHKWTRLERFELSADDKRGSTQAFFCVWPVVVQEEKKEGWSLKPVSKREKMESDSLLHPF